MIVKPDFAFPKARTARPAGTPPCEQKVRYPSRKLAAQHASRVTASTGEYTEPYHCRHHHCWHIGRPSTPGGP